MVKEAPVVVITGGGRGIGGETASELHDRGYRLALMSPSQSAVDLAAKLGALGLSGSTAEPNDLEALVEATLARYGRIDGLVNHTGGPPKGELLEISDEDWSKALDLVILNVVRLARLVTPVMERQGGGSIVNVTTFSAYEPDLRFPTSSVMRAGVGAFTRLYAERYAEKNIRMNCVLPGFIDSLDHGEETRLSVPMKRIGRKAEIAKTIAFLLSGDAGYITGESIRVDGGITRHI